MSTQNSNRSGFTLIEVLVTLVLVGLLVAFVFPVVLQQVGQADAPRAANDLANIRTAIEIFHVNVRPAFPGDIEDLANGITVADSTADSLAYSTGQLNRWNGPYVDASIAASAAGTDTVIISGFEGGIVNDLLLYDSSADAAEGGSGFATGNFVAIQVAGLTEDQFEDVNDLIDGESETDGPAGTSHIQGKLRRNDSVTATDTLVYYLAAPKN